MSTNPNDHSSPFDQFYSQDATDAWFKKHYQRAYEMMDYESLARTLSGRLRQLDKRVRATNARADAIEAAAKELKDALMDGLCNGGTPAFEGPEDRLDKAMEAIAALLNHETPNRA